MYYRVPPFGSFGQRKVIGGDPHPDPGVIQITPEQQNAIGAFVNADGTPFCTATAIAPRVVLSAAHCGAVGRGTRFVSGQSTLAPEFSATVLAVARHPQFRSGSSMSDFLLAYLDRDAPAALSLGGPPSVGEVVQTVGYGRTTAIEKGNTARWWLAESVREVRSEDFAVYASGQHGMCMGDSGGPALRMEAGKPVVIGTVSWGEQDCTGTDVFKRADVVRDWIRATIGAWEKSPPRPEVGMRAGVGWVVGLLIAGVAVGLVVRGR